jgi:hypothetical protein
MRKGLLTVTATHGKKVGRFRRGVGHGELELEMTRRASCLDVGIHRTRVNDWVCRTHRAVLVDESEDSVVVVLCPPDE